VSSYQYNGLGDRLQETVNGSTTTFMMDLNTGLTQALSDGTNDYIYGVGRIAQVNTGTEYFLGDALGSVRQLVNNTGEITYSRVYDPYGVITTTVGAAQTSYGYTGEYSGDSTQLLYLRARYYNTGMGRFISKDKWPGNTNQPISYNSWNYVQSNPINYADPSGYDRASCDKEPSSSKNIAYIENNVNLAKSDWLNTYTAAGIAVQCWRDKWRYDEGKRIDPDYNEDYAGFGPAQITNKGTSTLYGRWIEDPKHPGDKGYNRGYGLRCYIPVIYLRLPKEVQFELAKSCAFCFLKKQIAGITNFDQYFAPEPIYDQRNIDAATIYLKRMLQLTVNACKAKGCTATDIYIAVALAQNGPGFSYVDMNGATNSSAEVYKNDHIRIDWYSRFRIDIKSSKYVRTDSTSLIQLDIENTVIEA
jgi:RHS repeat-associated protein